MIREIAKHTPELCQLIMNAGGVAAIVDYIGETRGNVRLPGIMMLGYVAAHSETLAMAVIVSKVKLLYKGPNIANSFFLKKWRILGTFGDMGTEITFFVQKLKTRGRSE